MGKEKQRPLHPLAGYLSTPPSSENEDGEPSVYPVGITAPGFDAAVQPPSWSFGHAGLLSDEEAFTLDDDLFAYDEGFPQGLGAGVSSDRDGGLDDDLVMLAPALPSTQVAVSRPSSPYVLINLVDDDVVDGGNVVSLDDSPPQSASVTRITGRASIPAPAVTRYPPSSSSSSSSSSASTSTSSSSSSASSSTTSSSSSSSSSSSGTSLPVGSATTIEAALPDELFGGLLPRLPTITHGKHEHGHFRHRGKLEFTKLSELSSGLELGDPEPVAICHEIDITGFRATLYSVHAMVCPKDRVMFMIVGDKVDETYTYRTKRRSMRTILVLTEAQYHDLPTSILSVVDVLVLRNMVSATHGNFNEHLAQTSVQRTAAFIFSHHVGLKHFIMAPANIRTIGYRFNAHDKGAKTFFGLLKKRMGEASVIAISRNHQKEVRRTNLGTAAFMINMTPIIEALPLPQQMYWLMPQVADVNKWTELFYFQILLKFMFFDKQMPGRRMLQRKDAAINFNRYNKNQQNNQEISVEPISSLEPFNTVLGGEEAADPQFWITLTIAEVNRIIATNWDDYLKRKHHAEEGDLFRFHWDAQRGLPETSTFTETMAPVVDVRQDQAFIDMFKARLAALDVSSAQFRPYQRDALKAVAEFAGSTGHLAIPTGGGKTLLIYLLIREAWSLTNSSETLVVVTPQRYLLNQLFADFAEYYYNLFGDHQRPGFPFHIFMKVSSASGSLSVTLLMRNNRVQVERKVLLFCLESFRKYGELHPDKLSKIPMILIDECHLRRNSLEGIGLSNLPNTYVIGFTATPPLKNPLGSLVFEYPLEEAIEKGYAPPIITDVIGPDYSAETVVNLTECLPLLLNRYYPGYNELKRLVDIVGIVFLPTIADCDAAAANAKKAKIQAFAIYSGSDDTLDDVNKVKGGCVIFGVWSLRHGLNIPKIAYVLIAQNVSASKAEQLAYVRQMIGRAWRISSDPFKITYVIMFRDRRECIPESLRNSPLTVQPHQAYLDQEPIYYYPVNDTWKSTTNLDDIAQPIIDEGQYIEFSVNADDCNARLQLPPNAPVRTVVPTSSSSSSSSSTLLSPLGDHADLPPSATPLRDTSSSSQSSASDVPGLSSMPNSPLDLRLLSSSDDDWTTDSETSSDEGLDQLSSRPYGLTTAEERPHAPPPLSNLTRPGSPSFYNHSFSRSPSPSPALSSPPALGSHKRASPPTYAYGDYDTSSPERPDNVVDDPLPHGSSLSPSTYDYNYPNSPSYAVLPSSPSQSSSSMYGLSGRNSPPQVDVMQPSSPDAGSLTYGTPTYYGGLSSPERTPSPPGSPPITVLIGPPEPVTKMPRRC